MTRAQREHGHSMEKIYNAPQHDRQNLSFEYLLCVTGYEYAQIDLSSLSKL